MVFAQALSTFVGQNMGAGNTRRVTMGMWRTLFMSSAVSLAMTAVVIIFKEPLMGMFTKDSEVIRIGEAYLTIVVSFYLIFTTMFIFGAVMRGAGDTRTVTVYSFFSMGLIRVVVLWLLMRWMELSLLGVWMVMMTDVLVQCVLFVRLHLKGDWLRKEV